ncbi:major facilitator superfamily domain-containing protein [Rhexocercosporidium sp. MPI-PUGE-AT-0058]|nr:major facilitator superfamily domain-containing protein [Rhexocercosporidium sp. MPI-PUGE-AT-0058]
MSASSVNHLDPESLRDGAKTSQGSVHVHNNDGNPILTDTNPKELSLYEKKAPLINAEFNAMGMGRCQWYIWSLCGLGYFLDLLWALAFRLIVTPLKQELGFSSGELGNIFTAFNSGLCAGRRWAFNGTVLISCIFVLCLGAPDTYNAILVLTAFNGFGIGGNIPIDTTICLEFLPQNKRFLLAALSIFQPLGVVVCSGIALFIFLLRFVLFTFQESPKYLISRGRDEDATKVLHNVAKVNKYECKLSLDDFRTLEANHGSQSPSVSSDATAKLSFLQQVKIEFARIKILFSTPSLTRITILVWAIYAFDYWAFSVAGSFLPTILLRKNSAINVSVSETFRDYVIIYLPGILGVALGALMVYVPRIGRKWAMVFAAALMGISLFLFSTVNTRASKIGFNLMEYFFQSMSNAVLYGWTPEAFPAPIRGTASGVASFWGRLFSIVSPLIAAHLLETSLNGPLYLAGSGAFVCVIAIMFLPNSTLGGQST